jgi:hypothetical protein
MLHQSQTQPWPLSPAVSWEVQDNFPSIHKEPPDPAPLGPPWELNRKGEWSVHWPTKVATRQGRAPRRWPVVQVGTRSKRDSRDRRVKPTLLALGFTEVKCHLEPMSWWALRHWDVMCVSGNAGKLGKGPTHKRLPFTSEWETGLGGMVFPSNGAVWFVSTNWLFQNSAVQLFRHGYIWLRVCPSTQKDPCKVTSVSQDTGSGGRLSKLTRPVTLQPELNAGVSSQKFILHESYTDYHWKKFPINSKDDRSWGSSNCQ